MTHILTPKSLHDIHLLSILRPMHASDQPKLSFRKSLDTKIMLEISTLGKRKRMENFDAQIGS